MELRRKLEAHGPRLIHTVRGRGYYFGKEELHVGRPS
jgi:two-component system copper resistance phosphate regulon response regulator CusR